MTTILSGPMFEPATSTFWRSMHGKEGGHYNTFDLVHPDQGIAALRAFFPDGECNEYNLILFSTSGVHGSYRTIEEAEAELPRFGTIEDGEKITWHPEVTFCLIQPRICTIRCGNITVTSKADCDYLRQLRASSAVEFAKIGQPAEEPKP